jgi:hypothetical protein
MVVLDQQQHHTWAIPLPPGGCPARPSVTAHCSLLTARSTLPTLAGNCGPPCIGTFWYALAALRLASCKIASICRRFRPEYKSTVSGQQRMRSASDTVPLQTGESAIWSIRGREYVMAANSRHRLPPHDYPTSVLLSPRKYSSSRCTGLVHRTGTDSNVVGPRITTPKQYLIRSKGILTSIYRIDPGSSTPPSRHGTSLAPDKQKKNESLERPEIPKK